MSSVAKTLDASTRSSSLAVGDLVVYASHGIGRIARRENRGTRGARADVVVLEFADGLSVTLPVERAAEYLRPVSGKAQIARVQKTLRGITEPGGEAWQKRFRATQIKVAVGEALALAEVVRDGARRDDGPTVRGEPGRLSASERDLYIKARRLLAAEISAARGIDLAEADAWIGDQVAHTLTGVES